MHRVEQHDGHAEAHLQLGVLFRLKRERDKAIDCFRRAYELDDAGGDIGKRAKDLLTAMRVEDCA